MHVRRQVSSELSAQLVEYLLGSLGKTQDQLSEALEVSPTFISRVRSGERSFTLEHLELIEQLVRKPLGVILLAANPPKSPNKETTKIQKLAMQMLREADSAIASSRKMARS